MKWEVTTSGNINGEILPLFLQLKVASCSVNINVNGGTGCMLIRPVDVTKLREIAGMIHKRYKHFTPLSSPQSP